MELSELGKLSDEEKLIYLRDHNTELDQDSKLDVLKNIRNDDLKIEGITDSNITFNLTSKFKYWIWLTEENIPLGLYGAQIETIYEQFFKESNDEEKLECINADIDDISEFKVKVIESLEDEQLKVNYIDEVDGFDIDLSKGGRAQIIKSLKSDQLKLECLKKADFNDYHKSEVISSLSDDNLKVEYLEKVKNQFSSWAISRIVTSLKDESFRISCLEKVKHRCPSYILATVVSTLTDDEFKLDYMRTDKTFEHANPASGDKAIIIASLESDQLKIDCLTNLESEFNPYDRSNIIASLTDEQLKIECLTNSDINLKSFHKGEILESLEEEQLKIDCLSNSDINLESSDKGKIIRSLTEEQLKIDCLSNPNIELEQADKVKVISSLQSDEIKIKYMEDSSMGFNELDRLLIIWSLQDEKKFEIFEKLGILPDESYKKALDLPSNMTIGVELEAEGANEETSNFIGELLSEWKVGEDSSLNDGVEVISPILHTTKEDMYSLAIVCNIMQSLGLTTSKRCGGHIHFGADFFGSDPKTWEKFYTIYNECEEIFYKMSNETGQVPRSGILRYAMISNDVFAKMFETGEVSINNQEEFNQVIGALKKERYRGVNVANLGEDEKNTIEFRMPNGTLNPKVIRENINLFGSLLQVSKQMALDPEYRREDFEAIKQEDLTEKEKTEVLLNILFDDEEEKDIYRKRWDAVKDKKTFERLKAKKPTFIRGNYSMKDQSKEFFREVSPEGRAEFLQCARREIDNSRDTIEEHEIL